MPEGRMRRVLIAAKKGNSTMRSLFRISLWSLLPLALAFNTTSALAAGCGGKTFSAVDIVNAINHNGHERFENTVVRLIDDKFGTSIVIPSDVLFSDFTQPIIDPRFYPTMNEVVDFVKTYPCIEMSISGHTDNILAPSDQLVISERQAKSVADYLLSHDIDPDYIVRVAGYGSYFPIAADDNMTWLQRTHNRRVEITLHVEAL